MNKLTNDQLISISGDFGLPASTVKAITSVEASGSGFDEKTGKIKIQFEPTIFSKLLLKKGIAHTLSSSYENIGGKMVQVYEIKVGNKTIDNGVQGQLAEWEALREAMEIDKELALMSTSWGLGQTMGFNYAACGFTTVQEMVDSYNESEENQLRGMMKFIKSNNHLWDAVRTENWPVVAEIYNGRDYKKFNYDVRLKQAKEAA